MWGSRAAFLARICPSSKEPREQEARGWGGPGAQATSCHTAHHSTWDREWAATGWPTQGGRVLGLALDRHALCHATPLFQANAIGRGAKSVREFLEKNYTDEAIETDDLTIKLVIRALLEVSPPLKPGQDSEAAQPEWRS